MVNLTYLKNIIKNRTTIIMVHGKSIEELEDYIIDLKDKDICYTSLNYFDLFENYILNKINKKLDFVLDCADVIPDCRQDYEHKVRIPRLSEYLSRYTNNLWITTWGMIYTLMFVVGNEDFVIKYQHKILPVDDLKIRLDVPNSLVVLIGCCIAGGAKKIIICGADGYKGNYENNINSYYKKDLFVKERFIATGSNNYTNIIQETDMFDLQMPQILEEYKKNFDVKLPEIINCSLNSYYNTFRKISYKQLMEEI